MVNDQTSFELLQGLLLSAYLKMLLADPNDAQLRQQISAVYERYSHFMDADLQQRAVEYMGLMRHPDVASRNVTAMPKWEKRKSLLLRRMAEKGVGPFSNNLLVPFFDCIRTQKFGIACVS